MFWVREIQDSVDRFGFLDEVKVGDSYSAASVFATAIRSVGGFGRLRGRMPTGGTQLYSVSLLPGANMCQTQAG
jgi:hypothetical protein